MLNHVLRPIARNFVRRGTRSSSSQIDIKSATINDMPQSCGAWKEYYDARQKIYNTQLIVGIAVLTGTITFIKMSGIIFFNFSPPEVPVEKK